MTLSRSESLVPVARGAALAGLGLAMLLVGGAVLPMIHDFVESLGVLRGDRVLDAAVLSVLTAVVLAAYVATVAWWWYDRRTSLFVAASLVPLYGTYFFLHRSAFWI